MEMKKERRKKRAYLLTSYFITHNPQTHKSATASTASCPLVPCLSPSTTPFYNNTDPSRTHQGLGFSKDLKIYVYDFPSKYNTDWLSNKWCSNYLFSSKVSIHRALLNCDVRSLNPNEADFFFNPIYVSCNFSATNGFPRIGHAWSLISSVVQLISSKLHFWNWSQGSDHVFIASHDLRVKFLCFWKCF